MIVAIDVVGDAKDGSQMRGVNIVYYVTLLALAAGLTALLGYEIGWLAARSKVSLGDSGDHGALGGVRVVGRVGCLTSFGDGVELDPRAGQGQRAPRRSTTRDPGALVSGRPASGLSAPGSRKIWKAGLGRAARLRKTGTVEPNRGA